MNKRFLSVLAFALVVSLGATVLFYRLLAGRLTAEAPKPSTAKIIVAARNLEVGTLIRETDIRDGDWSGPLPANAIIKREEILGRGVVTTVFQGEPIISNRLASKGAGAGLAATIPQGMRAVAVRVNDIVGVAGFVVPGMRVDVLISGVPPGAQPTVGTVSRTLLQNLEVLAAGQNIQKDAEGKPILVNVVNLLVTPDQAESLTLATNETRIQLVLRNPLDTETTKTPGTAVSNLYSGLPFRAGEIGQRPAPVVHAARAAAPPPIARPKPAQPVVVEVYHGVRKSESKFNEAGEGQSNQ